MKHLQSAGRLGRLKFSKHIKSRMHYVITHRLYTHGAYTHPPAGAFSSLWQFGDVYVPWLWLLLASANLDEK